MASAVHKNTETKAASVNVNSVCRQNTVEQGMAAPDEFMAEVQWSMAIRKMIAKLEFGDALKLLMNDRDMSVENPDILAPEFERSGYDMGRVIIRSFSTIFSWTG